MRQQISTLSLEFQIQRQVFRSLPEDWKSTILAAASTHTNQHRARSPGETDEKNFAPVSKTVPRGQPDVDSANRASGRSWRGPGRPWKVSIPSPPLGECHWETTSKVGYSRSRNCRRQRRPATHRCRKCETRLISLLAIIFQARIRDPKRITTSTTSRPRVASIQVRVIWRNGFDSCSAKACSREDD